MGGRRESRGVVQSASYGARAFGVRSGMPIAEAARRCPEATFVQGTFASYRRASQAVRQVLEAHAPIVVMTGLDEGYLDFSGTDLLHPGSLLNLATTIRTAVRDATGLDCSIGIGPNRMVAKIASDYAKPRGICEVREGWEAGFLAGLPLSALPGIGPRTSAHLKDRGLEDVAQVQKMDDAALTALVGADTARQLRRRTSGRGGPPRHQRAGARSVSRETTFARDVTDPDHLDRVLVWLIAKMAAQLRDQGLVAGALVLKLRHSNFHTITRRRTCRPATADDAALRATARALLAPAFATARAAHQAIRLLGVAAVNLQAEPLGDLFSSATPAAPAEVTRAVDAVRARFGFDALRPGRMVTRPTPPPEPPSD